MEQTDSMPESYVVVIDAEEHYSIWPDWREIPVGWQATGEVGTKDACLAWIERVWTDMRPRSMRRAVTES
jgi:MbtH protein